MRFSRVDSAEGRGWGLCIVCMLSVRCCWGNKLEVVRREVGSGKEWEGRVLRNSESEGRVFCGRRESKVVGGGVGSTFERVLAWWLRASKVFRASG